MLENYSIHAWIQKYGIKNEKGEPIDFYDHPFLFDIYADNSPNIVVMKAAQVGLSTLDCLKTLYKAKQNKKDIIYTLPTDQDVQIFVGGKVNRLIAQNPILQEYTKDKDSIEQKQVGDSMIYFRGTWSKKAAIMVTADCLIHDEKDSSKQDVISDYQARLQHSKFKETHVFSHPSVPGYGVDVEWQLSDQKHWFITCPHCQKQQYLSWPNSIDQEKKIFVCKECNGELNNDVRRKGRWVQKFKDRKYSGYWISLLMAPWVSAKEIIDKYNDSRNTEEFFYNKILGQTYVGSGNKVTQNVIFDNLTNRVNSLEGRTIIGVDTGIDIRYVRGNNEGLFHYGQLGAPSAEYDPYSDLEKMLVDDDTAIMVIDQGGDIIGPRRLRERFPGRVFLCHYSVDRKTNDPIRWGEGDERGMVHVDRNRMIQLLIDELREKRLPIFGTQEDWYDYWLHWSHIYRVSEEDNLGVMRYKWLRSDRDDWVHATLYCRVGLEKFAHKGVIMSSGHIPLKVKPALDTLGDTAPAPKIVMLSQEEYDWRS